MNMPAALSVLEMRRRSVWEAADSGILLWRLNFLYFIPFFALPIWAAASALMFIPEESRWLSWFLLWWLKPLFDRLCLHVAAAKFFGSNSEPANTGFKQLFKGLGKMFRGLPGDLFWRRFSPVRSSSMPLRLLERSKKNQYRERKKVLKAGGLNFSALLSCIGPLIEAVLLGGEFIFARIFFEMFFPGASWSLSIGGFDTSLFFFAAYTFNYILVESLFVCMGFGIYINCRTEVEGWDIQLLFQKFAGDAEKKPSTVFSVPKKVPVAKTLLLCLGMVLFSFPLNADDEPLQNDSGEQTEETDSNTPKVNLPPDFMPVESIPYDDLQEILLSDDFGGTKPGWGIRLKNPRDPSPPTELNFPVWLERLKEMLALGLRALIVVICTGLAVFLIIMYLRIKRSAKNKGKNTYAYINPLLTGEDPKICFANAEDYFRRSLLREAWASCLCGVIASFDNYFGIPFPPDSTEYGCLEIVRAFFAEKVLHNQTAGFEELVKNWVFLAYGGRNPPEGSFEKSLNFGRSLKNTALGFSDQRTADFTGAIVA